MVRVHPRCQILGGYRSRDRIERYERSDCRSSRHTRTNPAFVQPGEDAALRTLKFRFESGGLDQFCAVVAEGQRRPIVYRDQKGSTPFHRASFSYGVEHDRPSALTFNQVIAGPIPPTLPGAKLIGMSRRLLTVRQSVRFAPRPPVCSGVAKRQCARLLTGRRAGSNPAPRAMPGNSAGRGDWSYKPAQLSSILRPGTKFRGSDA